MVIQKGNYCKQIPLFEQYLDDTATEKHQVYEILKFVSKVPLSIIDVLQFNHVRTKFDKRHLLFITVFGYTIGKCSNYKIINLLDEVFTKRFLLGGCIHLHMTNARFFVNFNRAIQGLHYKVIWYRYKVGLVSNIQRAIVYHKVRISYSKTKPIKYNNFKKVLQKFEEVSIDLVKHSCSMLEETGYYKDDGMIYTTESMFSKASKFKCCLYLETYFPKEKNVKCLSINDFTSVRSIQNE